MSNADLDLLRQARAFEQMPLRSELHQLHVPFDRLVRGTGGPGPWEGELDAGLRRGERIAVIGASGHGKSSLMEYVLGPTVDYLAPLPLPLGLEDPATVTEPAAFAAHLVTRVHRYVQASLPKHAGEAAAVTGDAGPARTHNVRLALPAWLTGGADLAYELESASEPDARTGSDHVDAARRLIELVEAAGLRPVLVLDDTDKWVRGPDGDVNSLLREGFFRRVVRLLAEDLGCAAVIAVHPAYLDDDAYREAASVLSRPVTVPRLTTVQAVASVLEHRQHVAGISAGAAFSPEAVAAVHADYARKPSTSLRSMLLLAHTSLAIACTDGAAHIGPDHVDLAVRELRT